MNSHFQVPTFADALYCDEHNFGEDLYDSGLFSKSPVKISDFNEIRDGPLLLSGQDLLWEDEEVVALLCKEGKEVSVNFNYVISNGRLKIVRNEAVAWMLKVVAHYGFKALTGVLAVNYFDRFITSLCFQTDKPWMGQLTAVACLSIAAKVEETEVPLLLDIQIEGSKYVFEAKTVQRMELLVLSTLQWRMNPVTAISFLDHIVRRFEFIGNLHLDFLKRCEDVILSTVTDCQICCFLPSVVAAATIAYTLREIHPCDAMDYENRILGVLRMNKEKIAGCHDLISQLMDECARGYDRKRKHDATPSSPNGVIDAYFSSDSSNESWSVAPSVSSSPEPMPKRSRGG